MQKVAVILAVELLVSISLTAASVTRYVDCQLSQSGNGVSWETAFQTIQEGIDAASESDQILVGPGTYVENVDFKGKGITLTSQSGPEVTIIDGNANGTTVTLTSWENAESILEGFTIRNGTGTEFVEGPPWWQVSFLAGGGIVCGSRSCVIRDNIITDNRAHRGAGIYLVYSGAHLEGNIIRDNTASRTGGGIYSERSLLTVMSNVVEANSAGADGGGAYFLDDEEGSLFIANNEFIRNIARDSGGGGVMFVGSTNGGIYLHDGLTSQKLRRVRHLGQIGGDIVFTANLVKGNTARMGGAGVFCLDSSPRVANNVITSNASAQWNGGGIRCVRAAANIICNTIVSNEAPWGGGGIYFNTGRQFQEPSPTIVNNIISDSPNGGGIYCDGNYFDPESGAIRHNNVWNNKQGDAEANYQNCSSSEGGISADPAFVDPENENYRLRPGSPCIDAGDNSVVGTDEVDLAGNLRIMFGGKEIRVDMGAYEYEARTPAVSPLSNDLRVIWSSDPGKTYSVFYSFDLMTWQLADDNVPSAGATTLWLDPLGWPPTVPLRFYRIVENE